jgi:4-amino-4-deoxy-L-arabinose transferase-like glycosyltransferase
VVPRARIEIVLSALLGTATIVTAVWPTWIEGLFGFEPDGGNGNTEWWIVAVLAVATIAATALARRDLRVARRPIEQLGR